MLSPLLDSRMANVLGDIFCVGAGGVDCESRESARGLGRGKVIVRNKGGLFGLACGGRRPGRVIWTARYQTEVRLERFSMVVVFESASWIEEPDMPPPKSPNSAALEKVSDSV
jgi:hypothetical protein